MNFHSFQEIDVDSSSLALRQAKNFAHFKFSSLQRQTRKTDMIPICYNYSHKYLENIRLRCRTLLSCSNSLISVFFTSCKKFFSILKNSLVLADSLETDTKSGLEKTSKKIY